MELKLNEPCFLKLTSPDGTTSVSVDVYVARRVLEEAEKEPTEEMRWKRVISFIAEQLKIEPALLAESTALEFHECINRIVIRNNADRKKKLQSIVALPDSTPASPTTSDPGP